MNKLRILTLLILFSLLLPIIISCNQEKSKPKKNQKQVNFIILLDLSDRIIKSNDQVNRDIEIIENIFNLFEKEVQKKAYVKSKDQFQIIISDQKNSNFDKTIYENKFYLNLENENLAKKSIKVDEIGKNLHSNLVSLYNKAKFSKNPDDYSGADIWKYFNEDLKSDLKSSPHAKNILIIISDGQLIVNGKKRLSENQSIKQIGDDFNNLSVALLEIVPNDIDNGYSQLTTSWNEWFVSMKIYNSYFDKKEININKVNNSLGTFVDDCISHKGSFEKKNINQNKKKELNTPVIKKTIIEKNYNVNKDFKIKKPKIKNRKKDFSSFFKSYNSINTFDKKIIFTIKNIDNFNQSKCKPSELKIIASDLYNDLLSNFPSKNELPKYSFCCSSKDKIIKFLKDKGFNTYKIENNFNLKCP